MEVDLVLDEQVIAAYKSDIGLVERLALLGGGIGVGVLKVLLKSSRVEVGRDGFNKDELVVLY